MKGKHIRQSKQQEQSPQPGMCGGIGEIPKEISVAGAPLGKETVVEKLVEGGQQPGLMVLVGHFKNFKLY